MQSQNDTTLAEIVSIICEVNPYVDIDFDSRLLEDGFIDSMGLVLVVSLLEARYEVVIPDAEVRLENFTDVRTIAALIEQLRGE